MKPRPPGYESFDDEIEDRIRTIINVDASAGLEETRSLRHDIQTYLASASTE